MKYITLALIFVYFTTSAQNFNANTQKDNSFLIGTWKVLNAAVPKNATASEKKAFRMMGPNLLRTTFKFSTGNKGEFKMPSSGSPLTGKNTPARDVYWSYDPSKQYVILSDWKNRKSIVAEFYVKAAGGNTVFILKDGPVLLNVAKQ